MKYNIWNKWDPLKVCMLGNNWGSEFFENIADDSIRSPMQRIANETLEELSYFEEVLKDFGCEVIRTKVDNKDRIENYSDQYFPVPRNALQPRDNQLVCGNKLYSNNYDNPGIMSALTEYSNDYEGLFIFDIHTSKLDRKRWNAVAGADWPSFDYFLENRHNVSNFEDTIWEEILTFGNSFEDWNVVRHLPTSANSFLIGNDVYMSHAVDLPMSRLQEIFPDTRINMLAHGHTHTDGCFHPIKPGAILSLHDFQNYENTFPGWDVCYLEGESWTKVRKFHHTKKQNFGNWWVPGEEDNDKFSKFVNDWLDNWVGYVEESVFDVNVLVLDEHHVCVNSLQNEQLNAFLKKHKMEAIHIPWKHRYFWDGGLHCITLDLVREGQKQDYFPNRKEPIMEAHLSD
jgi:hypothetical protein|tara:strand:+ start:1193 stop:2392 length:1200 start_codon:yes stop_codon:yes gene_type:complete